MSDSRKSLPESCALAIWVFLGLSGSSYAGPLKPIEKDNTGNAPAGLADLASGPALALPPTRLSALIPAALLGTGPRPVTTGAPLLVSPPLGSVEHGAKATEEARAVMTLAALVSDQLGDPFASLSYLNDDGLAPAMLGFAKVAAAASKGQGDRALAAHKAPKQAWGRPRAATALQVPPVLNAETAPEHAGGDDTEQHYRFTPLTPTDASEAPDAATPARPTGQVALPEPARPGTTVTSSEPNTRPRLAALLPSRQVPATAMPSLPATISQPSVTPRPRVAFPWPVPTSRAQAARRFQQQAALAPSPRSPGTTGLTPPIRATASRATALRVVGLRLALPPTPARRPFDANELGIDLMPGSKADRLANFLEGVSRGDSAGERSRDMWNFSFAEIVNGWARAGRHGELTLDRVARGTISRHEQARRRDMVRTLRKLDGSGNFAF